MVAIGRCTSFDGRLAAADTAVDMIADKNGSDEVVMVVIAENVHHDCLLDLDGKSTSCLLKSSAGKVTSAAAADDDDDMQVIHTWIRNLAQHRLKAVVREPVLSLKDFEMVAEDSIVAAGCS